MVADLLSKIRIASDGKGVDTNVKHSMVSCPRFDNNIC
jgi:hypothetical protein